MHVKRIQPKTIKAKHFISLIGIFGSAFNASTALSQSVVSVKVTKQEIESFKNQTFPNSDDLQSRIKLKVAGLLTTLSASQSGPNTKLRDFVVSQQQYSKKEVMFIKSVPGLWEQVGRKTADRSQLSSILSANVKSSLETETKDAFPILNEIQKGLKFSLYSSKTGGQEQSKPNIRYGLFVQEIIHTPSKGIAAYGNTIEQDLEYASQAKVLYRVEKLESNDGSNLVFTSLTQEEVAGPKTWISKSLPSPKFDVAIEAAKIDHSNASSSNKLGGKVTFTQIDGLYSMQCLSSNGLKFDNQIHTFTLPIAENIHLQREHDKKFKLTRTTVAYSPAEIPQGRLVANYNHIDQKSFGEFSIRRNSKAFSFNYETRAGWKPGQPLGLEKDVVSFKFENKF